MKNVFIIGMSRGIGAEFAKAFKTNGNRIGGISRSKPNHDAYDYFASVDIQNQEGLSGALSDFCEQFGKIDTLIINAGINGFHHPNQTSFSLEKEVVSTNLIGVLNVFECLQNQKILQNMNIILIGSLASVKGLWGSGGYCASKAGVRSLWEAYYGPLKKLKVHLQLVEPGFVRTDMIKDLHFPKPFEIEAKKLVDKVVKLEGKSSYINLSYLDSFMRLFMKWTPIQILNFIQSKLDYDHFLSQKK